MCDESLAPDSFLRSHFPHAAPFRVTSEYSTTSPFGTARPEARITASPICGVIGSLPYGASWVNFKKKKNCCSCLDGSNYDGVSTLGLQTAERRPRRLAGTGIHSASFLTSYLGQEPATACPIISQHELMRCLYMTMPLLLSNYCFKSPNEHVRISEYL